MRSYFVASIMRVLPFFMAGGAGMGSANWGGMCHHDRFNVRSVCALGPVFKVLCALQLFCAFGPDLRSVCALGPVFNPIFGMGATTMLVDRGTEVTGSTILELVSGTFASVLDCELCVEPLVTVRVGECEVAASCLPICPTRGDWLL